MQQTGDEGQPNAANDRAVLAALRSRLQARAKLPPLPGEWTHQSAMLAARGVAYGGDFVVAALSPERDRLQMVLVDVCGSGDAAVPAALQLAGALQGLLSAVPAEQVLGAANTFLLRQPSEENLATAVQVEVDLCSGDYRIRSAGHPPALRWSAAARAWAIDNARGTALGVSDSPEVHESAGTLAPGEALLFYTDGVVESRSVDIDDGIDWLRETARRAVLAGWEGVAGRIVELVPRGDDDRAVLVVQRRDGGGSGAE